MKITQLTILDAIVSSTSLKQAAEQCHKTQPALTMAMQKLEEEVGFTLIDRTGYRLKLTQAGERFYKQAKRVLTSCDELSKISSTLALGYEPKICIAYEQLGGDARINQLLGKIIQQFPSTQFEILGGSRFKAIEKLAKGEVDIGIGPWFDIFHVSGDFQSIELKPIEVILVASPKILPNKKSVLLSSELDQIPSLTLKPSELPFDDDKLSFAKGSQVVMVEELATLRSMLLQGVGWGLAAKHFCSDELASGELVQIDLIDGEDQFRSELRAFRSNSSFYGPVATAIWQGLKGLYHDK